MALDTNTLYIPEPSHRYRGAQVIITSDRLTFNAKNDSILLYSKRDIGFSAEGSIYFDTNKKSESINSSKFIVNSPEIYLGLQDEGADINKLPVERAVLGNSLRIFLTLWTASLSSIFSIQLIIVINCELIISHQFLFIYVRNA